VITVPGIVFETRPERASNGASIVFRQSIEEPWTCNPFEERDVIICRLDHPKTGQKPKRQSEMF
jgi:hypothetical protein